MTKCLQSVAGSDTNGEGARLLERLPHGLAGGFLMWDLVLSKSLDKSVEWAVIFFFINTGLSLAFWNIISGISGFDDYF